MTREELVQKIEELKKQKNAIVLAHYYSTVNVILGNLIVE